jgi:hypothetical protein
MVCLKSPLCFSFDAVDASGCFMQVKSRRAFVSNHVFGFICNMHSVILVFLYGRYYMLFMLFLFNLHSFILTKRIHVLGNRIFLSVRNFNLPDLCFSTCGTISTGETRESAG